MTITDHPDAEWVRRAVRAGWGGAEFNDEWKSEVSELEFLRADNERLSHYHAELLEWVVQLVCYPDLYEDVRRVAGYRER